MNSIIMEANRVSSETSADFLDRQIDDVLWSIRNPTAPGALDYVRDASEKERIEAEPIVAHILQCLAPSTLSGVPGVFDADRARRTPDYSDRGNWIVFDRSVLLHVAETNDA